MLYKIKTILEIIVAVCTIFGITISPSLISFDNPLSVYISLSLVLVIGLYFGWRLKEKYCDRLERSDETISDLKEAPYEVKVNIARAYINGYFIEEDPEESSYSAIAYSAIGAMGYAKPSTDKYLEFCVKVSTRDGYRYELKPEIRRIIKKNQDIIEDAKNDI